MIELSFVLLMALLLVSIWLLVVTFR